MAIKFVAAEERTFPTLEERMKTDPLLYEMAKDYSQERLQAGTFFHHVGSDDELELFEVNLPANYKNQPHAHDADEIIVVVHGEIRFGNQAFGVGSSVFIPKMTLYSFQAGPQGLRFLNFRPTRSPGVIPKDKFMALRDQKKGG